MRDANLGNGNPEQRSGFYKHLVGAPQKSAKRKRKRLHLVKVERHGAGQRVTVPVRGIRLHLGSLKVHLKHTSYCPREGYKVASVQGTDGGQCQSWLLSP